MFGYLQPEKNELKLREWELYKSVYCGLCRHLGKDYGVAARLTLSYDCTVLAMLSMALTQESCSVKQGRCTVNPLKKCLMCDSSGSSFSLAGAVSVIMAYYKLSDTIHDSGLFKKTGAALLKLLLKRSCSRAERAYPAVGEAVRQMLQEQWKAEAEGAGIDAAAMPTARMLSQLCISMGETEEEKKILEVFGYYLGRWIYLMDAADDLEKDLKKGSFNPFIRGKEGASPEERMQVLNFTLSCLEPAYDLLELRAYRPILDNIVYYGLSYRQRYCLFLKKKRDKGQDHYRELTGAAENSTDP